MRNSLDFFIISHHNFRPPPNHEKLPQETINNKNPGARSFLNSLTEASALKLQTMTSPSSSQGKALEDFLNSAVEADANDANDVMTFMLIKRMPNLKDAWRLCPEGIQICKTAFEVMDIFRYERLCEIILTELPRLNTPDKKKAALKSMVDSDLKSILQKYPARLDGSKLQYGRI